MLDKNVVVDMFAKRVLTCMKEQSRNVKEVQEEYMRLYPPGFFRRQLSNPVSEHKIETALKELLSFDFLLKEITRFHGDKALRKDIIIYRLTNKGRSYLLIKKK